MRTVSVHVRVHQLPRRAVVLTAVACPPVAAVTNAAVVGTGRSYLEEVEIICDQTGQSCTRLSHNQVGSVPLHV